MVDLSFLFYVLVMLFGSTCIAAIIQKNFHVMFYYIIGVLTILLTGLIFLTEVFNAAK